MMFLDVFELGSPLTTGQAFFLIWSFGATVGYCFGRVNTVRNQFSDCNNKTVEQLDKGNK